MAKFRKKPIVIEAMQFTEEAKERVLRWVTDNSDRSCWAAHDIDDAPIIKIETLEGVMAANIDDWIIKGVQGEFYPCKPDIFDATYDPAEQGQNNV